MDCNHLMPTPREAERRLVGQLMRQMSNCKLEVRQDHFQEKLGPFFYACDDIFELSDLYGLTPRPETPPPHPRSASLAFLLGCQTSSIRHCK